jgi:dihydrofolate reductase
MLWHISEDFKNFKSITSGHHILMGRKTFESIGRPLPNRKNIVISSWLEPQEGLEVVSNLNQAIEVASLWNKDNSTEEEIVLIGGGYVFEESKNIVNKLVLTRVECEIDGDVFYPEIDLSHWKEISKKSYKRDSENEYDFKIETFVKT